MSVWVHCKLVGVITSYPAPRPRLQAREAQCVERGADDACVKPEALPPGQARPALRPSLFLGQNSTSPLTEFDQPTRLFLSRQRRATDSEPTPDLQLRASRQRLQELSGTRRFGPVWPKVGPRQAGRNQAHVQVGPFRAG